MGHFAWIASLCLLAGSAAAGTFELTDPANEMYEQQQAREEAEAEAGPEAKAVLLPRQASPGNVLCTVDTANGDCGCIDRKMAKKLAMTREECADRVLRALKIWEP